jgi:hypothetical protein
MNGRVQIKFNRFKEKGIKEKIGKKNKATLICVLKNYLFFYFSVDN